MAKIHKLIDPGAEAYLPFLLARERSVRSRRESGRESMSGGYAMRYDFGDVQAELRMTGNESFVVLRNIASRDPSASKAWVAFMFDANTWFTQANNRPIYNGPDTSERPTPPPPPPTDDGVNIPPPDCRNYPPSDQVDPATGATFSYTSMQAAIQARKDALMPYWTAYHSYILGIAGHGQDEIDKAVKNSNFGSDNYCHDGYHKSGFKSLGFNQETGIATVTYVATNDFSIPYIQWMLASAQAHKAWSDAAEARRQAYEQELAQWAQSVLRPWEEKNLPSLACPPYYRELMPLKRAGRAAQIAALKSEMLLGVKSLPVAIGALHPTYIPKEQPEEEFVTGFGSWTGPGQYSSLPAERVINNEYSATPIFPTCGDMAQAFDYENVYASRDTYAPAPLISTIQGYGYTVTGRLYQADRSTPTATIRYLDGYGDWINSRRVPGFRNVSFDLVHGDVVGQMCIALFEFYAYDYKTDEWVWTPSVDLLQNEPVNSCYSICYTYPDHEREATYTNRPDPLASVVRMRSFAFLRHTKTPTGWSDAEVVTAPAIELDITDYSIGSPPSVWCAVVGAQEWMVPQAPGPSTAVDKNYMKTAVINNTPTTGQDIVQWIHAQCLSRFQITFN